MEKFSNPMAPQGGGEGMAAKLSQIDALVKEVMAMTSMPKEKEMEEDIDAVMGDIQGKRIA